MAYDITDITGVFNEKLFYEGVSFVLTDLPSPIYRALTDAINMLNNLTESARDKRGAAVVRQLVNAVSQAESDGTFNHEVAVKVAKAAYLTVADNDGFYIEVKLPRPPEDEEKEDSAATALLNEAMRELIDEDEIEDPGNGGAGSGDAGNGAGGVILPGGNVGENGAGGGGQDQGGEGE